MSETSEADPADRKLELDAKRLQVEIANLSLDSSSPNKWETGILSAAVTLPSLNVLELFISHPERF